MIYYNLQPVHPEAHLFGVTMRIPRPDPQGQRVTLPSWILGSYMIRDFAKNIVTLEAYCGDTEIALEKVDKQTWCCAPCSGELELRYQVYAWDLSVRTAHLDTTHGYFNGTSLFLKAVGQEQEGCQVEIHPPAGERYNNWKVATTLPTAGAEQLGFGMYQAADYDELVDHPVEMGEFTFASFTVAGVPHEIAITGRHDADLDRICRDLQAICEYHVGLFGELPPMQRYLFQVMAVGDGYGGLEHRSSTSLLCKRSDLPRHGEEKVSNGYRDFLGLCSHEYFHLWNVKRIRPQVFKEADLSREVHTRLLWAFEGITSYYDDLSLVRSGRIDAAGYLDLLARVITRVRRGSGRQKQTLEESSYDAWTKFYKADENAPNAIVSYYSKGALVALTLDLLIRWDSDGEKSLDDLMRTLWERYGRPDKGVGEEDIEALAQEITGLDMSCFFEQALRGTDELPLPELLGEMGIGYRLRAARNAADKGGVAKGEEDQPSRRGPVLGATVRDEGGEARVKVVFDHGAAQKAGLSAGDVIVAVDGLRVTAANLEQRIADIPEGYSVRVHAFRRDELMHFDLKPQAAPEDTCELWLLDNLEQEQIERRQAWLATSS
jgi:predicted metalloprotease with PDZ domain